MAFEAAGSNACLDFESACDAAASLAQPLGCERTALEDAHGRVLAESVIARRDAPPHPVSAMDGYAVRDADLGDGPTALTVVGECFAGDAPPSEPLAAGCCLRVSTGAPTPPGADRVVIQEIVERSGDRALIAGRPAGGRHIRAAGTDFRAGEMLLPRGARLSAQALVAAAGADVAELSVFRRPRVAILGTGNELADPGSAWRTPGAVADSVSLGVAALARDWGADVLARLRADDDLQRLTTVAAEALEEADVVVVTGGASVGERDYAKAMFAPSGLELVVPKVAMKPGKPVWIGRARGKIVVGLPGNPSAAMVAARLLLAPILAGLGGRDPREAWGWRPVRLSAPLEACGQRDTFVGAISSPRGAEPASCRDSSRQMPLAACDLLLRLRPGDPPRAARDLVDSIAL